MIEFAAQHPILTCGLAIVTGAVAATIRGALILRHIQRTDPDLWNGHLVGTVTRGPWGAT